MRTKIRIAVRKTRTQAEKPPFPFYSSGPRRPSPALGAASFRTGLSPGWAPLEAALYCRAVTDGPLGNRPRGPERHGSEPPQAADPQGTRPDPFLTRRRPRAARDESSSRQASPLAPLALGFSLAGFVCLPFGGLLGLALGIAARGEIQRADAAGNGSGSGGRGLATAAILLGGVNVMVTVVAAAIGLLWLSDRAGPWQDTPEATLADPSAQELPGPRPVSKPVAETQVGEITVVDVNRSIPSLGAELERQRKVAEERGERLLLWLVVPECAPCQGVETALHDPRMQEALQKVRLVRLNAADFQIELHRMHVPTHAIPGFALLGKNGRPVDYVHGGEWDADIAQNIAPVLGGFIRGNYIDRRYPWRGGIRQDETAL